MSPDGGVFKLKPEIRVDPQGVKSEFHEWERERVSVR